MQRTTNNRESLVLREKAYDETGISVIVPVYNGIKFIDTCMDSVLSQTLKNIQIILVDDGSTDESGNILDAYAMKYDNVEVVHRENGGLGMARNSGMEVAKYEFIGCVDVDDTIVPEMYEEMYRFIKQTSADCVCCDINVVDFDKSEHSVIQPYDQKVYAGEDVREIKAALLGFSEKNTDGLPSAWSKLYRKSVIDKYHLAYNKRTHGEDWQFLLEYLATGASIAFLHKVLYNYIHHSKESLVTKYRDDFFDVALNSRLLFEQIYPEFDWNSPEKIKEKKDIPISSMLYFRKYLDKQQLQKKADYMLKKCKDIHLYHSEEKLRTYQELYTAVKNNDSKRFFDILYKHTTKDHLKDQLKQKIKEVVK